MTELIPMRPSTFPAFAEEAIADYARDSAQAGRWSEQEAPARARAEFQRLLPLGLDTPNHFFYEILGGAEREPVGSLWFALDTTDQAKAGYLYSIRVAPAFRGRGHAKEALDLLEGVALDMGLAAMSLHVFSHNTNAQALYRASGYWTTGVVMRKPLRRPTQE